MLKALAQKYGCDKVDANHTHLNMSYCDIYERYFGPIRHEKLVIMEIGVREGASIRMWQEYFPNAEIHGIDIDPNARKLDLNDQRTTIHIADQNNGMQIRRVLRNIGKPIDIVIDDGSHITRHQLYSYALLSPRVTRYYIIEDLRCSYQEFLQGHNLREIWPGMKYNNPDDELTSDRSKIDRWLLDNLKLMDFHNTEKLFSIHCYPMIFVIEYAH